MSDLAQVASLAVEIALDAGALQRRRFSEPRTIDTKSSSIDLVTDVDRASEKLIVERIQDARPRDGILSEELGNVTESRNGWLWVIDPLDGTTNYAHGVPHFAVSIGVEHDGEREVGVVYDPIQNESFTAVRGLGTTLNGIPTCVSSETRLDRALLATLRRPYAYLIPAELTNVIDKLRQHGVVLGTLDDDAELSVEVYRIDEVKHAEREFQKHRIATVEATPRSEPSRMPAGTVVVRTGQPLGNLIVYMLEPECEDGLTAWNYFDEQLRVDADFPVVRMLDPIKPR